MTQIPSPLPGRRLHASGRLVPDGLDDDLIGEVLADFYAKVRSDSLLGPIFGRAIADDQWPHHLAVIHDFWSSMLLGTGRYAGRPMPKHLGLPDLDDTHFARWLQLFRETVERLCPAEVATLFVDRAERIAHSFRIGLAIHRGEDSTSVAVMRAKPQ